MRKKIYSRLVRLGELPCLSGLSAFVTPGIVVGIFITLALGFVKCFSVMGMDFFFTSEWDFAKNRYGVLVFLTGTFFSAVFALILSTPFSLAIALLVSEVMPRKLYSRIISRMVNIMSAIPSVIIGLWGIYTISPAMRMLGEKLGYTSTGIGFISASLALTFMIIPFSATLMREVISLTPQEIKEAAFSLGATHYETVRFVVLPYAGSGIFGSLLLSMGRAIGETMVVTMLIGNSNHFIKNIFSSTNTMSSLIANEFAEAADPVYYSALMGVGLTLMLLTMFISLLGKWILRKITLK